MGCIVSSPDAPGFHDRYVVGAVVGTGSFAQTRRVTRVADGSEALVKIIDIRVDERHTHEALNEIRIWQRLGSHVHVVELAEVFEDRSFYYLVMELCEEGFMDRLQAMAQVTEWTLAPILYEVLHALAHVHAAHVIHGDVKPNNFFFKDGILKLSDFGLSAISVPGDDDQPTGHLGYVAYMSPEMLQDVPYNVKTDVWSAGVIAYLLMYGEMPHSAKQYGAWCLEKENMIMVAQSMARSASMSMALKRASVVQQEKQKVAPITSGTVGLTANLNARKQLKAVIKDGLQSPRYRPFNEEADVDNHARRPPLSATCEAFLHSLLTRDPEMRPAARATLQLDFLAKPPPAKGALGATPCLRPAVAQAAAIVHKQATSVKQSAAWKSAAKLLMEKQRMAGHRADFGASKDAKPSSLSSTASGEVRTALDGEVPTSPPPLPLGLDDGPRSELPGELGAEEYASEGAGSGIGRSARVHGLERRTDLPCVDSKT